MNIINKPSPNFLSGRQGYKPQAIIIHIMQGTLYGTDSWFQSSISKTSAHYGIGKMGQIHQYVNEKDTALHVNRVNAPTWSLIKSWDNGLYLNPNYYTIGIEHEGDYNNEWTDEMYEISGKLISEISLRWNIPINRQHIIGHHEIYSLKKCLATAVDIHKLISIANDYALSANQRIAV
jgi:N-acetylmuramoyl-L-alanine amidase